MVISEAEARCVAGGIVDGVGEDRIEELGFTPDNVDMIEGAVWIGGCGRAVRAKSLDGE
jgi:hypothetical protein